MKRKLKIAVLMGGKSPEHEVSVISGMEVVKSLSNQKYEVLPVIVVLEINTIPGLTPMSLFPKAAKAMGISYSHLLDNIIKYAIEKD